MLTEPSAGFEPPAAWSREEVLAASDAVLAMVPGAVTESEDIFRLSALGLDWDIGVRVYEPQPRATIAAGADRKKVGILLLHGGAGDYKSMDRFALLFAERFACKVVTMTFPGRLYLDDESRDWPGDTIRSDGSVRTPIWRRGEHVTPDQYDLVEDASKRMKYGVRRLAPDRASTTAWRHGRSPSSAAYRKPAPAIFRSMNSPSTCTAIPPAGPISRCCPSASQTLPA